MGKSRTEIQRAYRERKETKKHFYKKKGKENGDSMFLQTNYQRQIGKYEIRKTGRILESFMLEKKALRTRLSNEISGTSGYESNGSNYENSNSQNIDNNTGTSVTENSRGRLLVRMGFNSISEGKRKAALKRWKRDRSAAQSRIRLLEQERNKLKTKLKSTQRSLQRLKRDRMEPHQEQLTPSKQTEHDMTAARLNRDQKAKLRRSLLLGNVISSEIKDAKKTTPRHKMKALHNIVAGRIAKRYRCVRYLSMKTGLGRRQLGGTESKVHQLHPGKRNNKLEKYRHVVVSFMKREDNSRIQPGKKDANRPKKGEKCKSKYLLISDYLKNLYLKFKSEHPEINISFPTFCRTRPSYIYKTSLTSRIACLCFKHQNAALTVKSLRRHIEVPANHGVVLTNRPNRDILNDKLPEDVMLSQWTRVETEAVADCETIASKSPKLDSFFQFSS